MDNTQSVLNIQPLLFQCVHMVRANWNKTLRVTLITAATAYVLAPPRTHNVGGSCNRTVAPYNKKNNGN